MGEALHRGDLLAMGKVGSIALYLEVSNQEIWENHEARAVFVCHVFGKYEDGLRAGPKLAARKDYVGLLICAFTPMGYKRMLLCSAEIYGKELEGPWGKAKCIRIDADDGTHPWIRTLDLSSPPLCSMLDAPVKLRVLSPLKSPFSILKDLQESQRIIWEYSGREDLKVFGDLPHWMFTHIRLRPHRDDNSSKTGSLNIFSSHRMANFILQFSILRGFGSEKGKGFGSLDVSS